MIQQVVLLQRSLIMNESDISSSLITELMQQECTKYQNNVCEFFRQFLFLLRLKPQKQFRNKSIFIESIAYQNVIGSIKKII